MPRETGSTIQTPGPQNLAQLFLGLKGGNVPQNILVPDLLGTIELGRRTEIETLFAQDILPVSVGVDVAGVAAQFSFFNIQPGFDDRFVFVIEGFEPTISTGTRLVAGWQNVGVLGGAIANWQSRDSRFGTIPTTTGTGRLPKFVFGTTAALAPGPPALWIGAQLNSGTPLGQRRFPGAVLHPRSPFHFFIACETALAPLGITVWGYSVPLRAFA